MDLCDLPDRSPSISHAGYRDHAEFDHAPDRPPRRTSGDPKRFLEAFERYPAPPALDPGNQCPIDRPMTDAGLLAANARMGEREREDFFVLRIHAAIPLSWPPDVAIFCVVVAAAVTAVIEAGFRAWGPPQLFPTSRPNG
jgi:hypothetical protein